MRNTNGIARSNNNNSAAHFDALADHYANNILAFADGGSHRSTHLDRYQITNTNIHAHSHCNADPTTYTYTHTDSMHGITTRVC